LFNRGKPSLVCVTENFSELAKDIAQSREVPEIPITILSRNVESMSKSDLKQIAETVVKDLVSLLVES
jgi:hypothetical protein